MLSVKRILGIMFVFFGASISWVIFGAVMSARSSSQQSNLAGHVAELWGERQTQAAPVITFHWDAWEIAERTENVDGKVKSVRERVKLPHADAVSPDSSTLDVGLHLDQRLKGLVWYALYDVDFAGAWTYTHEQEIPGTLTIAFAFSNAQGLYDDFRFTVDGVDRARDAEPKDGSIEISVPVTPGQTIKFAVGYRSRGMDEWTYVPAPSVASLEHFELRMTTDFEAIDFPLYSMSPSARTRTQDGWALAWKFARVVTGHRIGMLMPQRIQPGEMAAELSFSAPISLLFFFLLLFVLATLRGIDLHPINYFFLAGAFFAFHLLFGYSVDHLHIVPAFVLASIVSILLVVTYLRLVVSPRFAFVEAALAQLVYLVGFSLAHFWDGYTGLTVTVLSILTLFVLMQLTGRLRWSEVLRRGDK